MSVIWVLVSFSVLVAAGFLGAFIWAVRSGQYDDRHTPSIRMLFDDRSSTRNGINHQSRKGEGSSIHGTADHQIR